MDIDAWEKIYGVLSDANAVRSGGAARGGSGQAHDAIGDIHLLFFLRFQTTPSSHREGAIHRDASGARIQISRLAPESASIACLCFCVFTPPP